MEKYISIIFLCLNAVFTETEDCKCHKKHIYNFDFIICNLFVYENVQVLQSTDKIEFVPVNRFSICNES